MFPSFTSSISMECLVWFSMNHMANSYSLSSFTDYGEIWIGNVKTGIASQPLALTMFLRMAKLSSLLFCSLEIASSIKKDKHEWILLGKFTISWGTSYSFEKVLSLALYPYYLGVKRATMVAEIKLILSSSI